MNVQAYPGGLRGGRIAIGHGRLLPYVGSVHVIVGNPRICGLEPTVSIVTSSRATTVGRVLDALGISQREPESEAGPMMPQADDISQDWVFRFRQEDADHQLTS